MFHLGCLGLIIASEIQKILVDVIELGVVVKHSRFLKLFIVYHYLYDKYLEFITFSVIKEVVFLFKWQHAIDKLFIVNLC